MLSDLTHIVHGLVLDSTTPAKDIAKAINKPYSTLLREVNPYDSGAKLGVETLLQVMKCTGDTRPLEYMANQLGYRLEHENKSTRAQRNVQNHKGASGMA